MYTQCRHFLNLDYFFFFFGWNSHSWQVSYFWWGSFNPVDSSGKLSSLEGLPEAFVKFSGVLCWTKPHTSSSLFREHLQLASSVAARSLCCSHQKIMAFFGCQPNLSLFISAWPSTEDFSPIFRTGCFDWLCRNPVWAARRALSTFAWVPNVAFLSCYCGEEMMSKGWHAGHVPGLSMCLALAFLTSRIICILQLFNKQIWCAKNVTFPHPHAF